MYSYFLIILDPSQTLSINSNHSSKPLNNIINICEPCINIRYNGTGTDHYAGWGEFEGAVAEDGGGGGAASSASLLVRCVCKTMIHYNHI